MFFRWIMGIFNHIFFIHIFCNPLIGSSWTFYKFIFIFKQYFKITHSPFCWIWFPCTFNSTTNCIRSLTCFITIFPTKSHFFNRSAFRGRTNKCRRSCPMTFTKGMTTSYKCYSFLIIHSHTSEGFSNIFGRSQWVRFSIRPLWIYINQSHLNCCKWIFNSICTWYFIARKLLIHPISPINILWLPNIFTSTTKANCFKPHYIKSTITC